MAHITINDLSQSDALDREAMRSILGGALTGARPVRIAQEGGEGGSGHIVDYPPGFGHQAPLPTGLERPAGGVSPALK